MTNIKYDKGSEAIMAGTVLLLSDDIRVCGFDSGYKSIVNLQTHQFLSDIPFLNRVFLSLSLTGKTGTGGVFDAADLAVSGVAADLYVHGIAIFKHTGSDATARLVWYGDAGANLPMLTTGAPFTIKWGDGPSKIFKI